MGSAEALPPFQPASSAELDEGDRRNRKRHGPIPLSVVGGGRSWPAVVAIILEPRATEMNQFSGKKSQKLSVLWTKLTDSIALDGFSLDKWAQFYREGVL
jgi:hypothetical protein